MSIRRLGFLLVAWLVLSAAPASAEVTLALYSRDFGESFPHAFFTVTGTTADAPDAPIDASYGFTAKHLTPSVLTGSVLGEVESIDEAYRRKSLQHMSFPITDAQYHGVMATVQKWRDIPGKSYNLNTRNCVFFVADIARTLGMAVVEMPGLMKKPRSFLDDLGAHNLGFETAQIALTSAPVVPLPPSAVSAGAPVPVVPPPSGAVVPAVADEPPISVPVH